LADLAFVAMVLILHLFDQKMGEVLCELLIVKLVVSIDLTTLVDRSVSTIGTVHQNLICVHFLSYTSFSLLN
jgi:hypothetical protein